MIDDVASVVLAHTAATASTPTEAVTVLNVLPKARARTVLSAALSRGFTDFNPLYVIDEPHGPALLPHYPSYILFDNLRHMIVASAAEGDMATLTLLWQLAGPTSPCRMLWFDDGPDHFIDTAIMNGHVSVLDFVSQAADALDIPIDWPSLSWGKAADAGHTEAVMWAIERGYNFSLAPIQVLLSTQNGNMALKDWWIDTRPGLGDTLRIPHTVDTFLRILNGKKDGALEWWWTSMGSVLPDPETVEIVTDIVIASRNLDAVECWWARFLEHRTPEHAFCQLLEVGQVCDHPVLDWYWDRFHDTPEYFGTAMERVAFPHGIIFSIRQATTLDNLQWAIDKCAELDGQKLELHDEFFDYYASNGSVEMLDLALRSADVLITNWTPDMESNAVKNRRFAVLEWLDLHRDQLPPQNAPTLSDLMDAVRKDAVDVVAWWHARYPTSKDDWQKVCAFVILINARKLQVWLRDHPDLYAPESDEERHEFRAKCNASLQWVMPFSFDFIDFVVPDLATGSPRFSDHPRANVSLASLVPLSASLSGDVLANCTTTEMEWWLQMHLAKNQPLDFPHEDELDEIYQVDDLAHRWMYDVTVTRGIPVCVQREDFETHDLTYVPYTAPPLPFL